MSVVSYEAGWDSAYCGSLVDDFGTVYACRVAGSSTKLYTGDWQDSLSLKSTLTFQTAINPFGLVFSWLDNSVYAAAAASNSYMVIRANSPFTAWTDVTYNHSTAAGINALVAL